MESGETAGMSKEEKRALAIAKLAKVAPFSLVLLFPQKYVLTAHTHTRAYVGVVILGTAFLLFVSRSLPTRWRCSVSMPSDAALSLLRSSGFREKQGESCR